MASMTNNEKILQAVLLDDKLMEFGGYTAEDIGNIYQPVGGIKIIDKFI